MIVYNHNTRRSILIKFKPYKAREPNYKNQLYLFLGAWTNLILARYDAFFAIKQEAPKPNKN
ncbi:hypothetical protein CSHOW_0523 [Campylobacter showae]|nr:hypothetical protein CSHOW_0523 [Campylobacter showae]